MSTEDRIRAFYAAFNDRAIDTVLAAMTADVDWPNGWEGGRIAARVEPVEITRSEDGRWTALVHQVVRSPDGTLLADDHVRHVYAFRDELVERMDIEAVQPAQG